MDCYQSKDLHRLSKESIEKAFKKTVDEVEIPADIPRCKLIFITEDLYEKALEIPKQSLIEDEPLCKSICLQWSDEIESIWLRTFDDNLSFMLLNEDDGEVIGFKATAFIKRGDHVGLGSFKDVKLREIFRFLCMGDAEYFEKYNTKEAFYFFGLGVAREYRGRGVGTFLINIALQFLNNLGISQYYIKSEATSHFTQKIFDKVGFNTISEYPYAEYQKYGKVLFDNTGEHKSMKCYGKCFGADSE